MTSYDQIWQTFLENCRSPEIDIPTTQERIYAAIGNGVMYFNNKFRTTIVCNDDIEELSQELNNDQLLILGNYIKLFFLLNRRTYFEGTWQPFSSDIGLKNYAAQLRGMTTSILEQETLINRLIMNQEEDYL